MPSRGGAYEDRNFIIMRSNYPQHWSRIPFYCPIVILQNGKVDLRALEQNMIL